jgi:hypothetical protein
MMSWRERLCGSVVLKTPGEEGSASIKQLLGQNEILTCGGGFYPVNLNTANMSSFKNNFILPTDKYSVLVFKQDGNAVIYSEEDEVVSGNKDESGSDGGFEVKN